MKRMFHHLPRGVSHRGGLYKYYLWKPTHMYHLNQGGHQKRATGGKGQRVSMHVIVVGIKKAMATIIKRSNVNAELVFFTSVHFDFMQALQRKHFNLIQPSIHFLHPCPLRGRIPARVIRWGKPRPGIQTQDVQARPPHQSLRHGSKPTTCCEATVTRCMTAIITSAQRLMKCG